MSTKAIPANQIIPIEADFKDGDRIPEEKMACTDENKSNDNLRIDRQQCIEKILYNKSDAKIGAESLFYCVLSVAFSICSTILVTCWPQHETIGDSTYWYESTILNATGQVFFASQLLVFSSYFSLGIGMWESYKTTIITWFFAALTMFLVAGNIYLFWIYLGDKVWPMPFQGYIVMSIGWWAVIIAVWTQSVKKWKSPNIRKKVLWGIILINCTYIAEMTYIGVQFLFAIVDETWHWPLVIVIILVRELHCRGLAMAGRKINGCQDFAMDIDAVTLAAIRHILFLSVNLGSMTTELTSYLILASDFTINLGDCAAVIWYHKKGGEANEKKKVGALVTLISNEAIEFILPLAYVSVLLLSYYGPNAEIMGNVKNGSWQYAEIENINDTLFWLMVMFMVDSLSTVVSTLLLQTFCNINIVKMYFQILKHMGFLFALQVGYYISEVKYLRLYIYIYIRDRIIWL